MENLGDILSPVINNAVFSHPALQQSFFGNSAAAYLMAAVIFILFIIIFKIFKYVILRKLKEFAKKTKSEWDDLFIEMVDSVRWPVFVLVSFLISIRVLSVPEMIGTLAFFITIVAVVVSVASGISRFIEHVTEKTARKEEEKEGEIDTGAVELMGKLGKAVVWILAILMILAGLGIEITPLIAGLGVGGIAIAFAVQNILSDLFSSLSIYFDKPFQRGDFIVVGQDMGVVKKVGMQTTRIQTLQGQELVISNKELTSSRINNYKRMQKRRIAFSFGVTYETPVERLKKIPGIVKKIVDGIEVTKLDRVHFQKFGDFALMFEVVYYINTRDYNKYMDTQQEINLKIMEAFEKEKIDMAYPTQTLYVRKT